MARLPIPGADNGTWGEVLNDFLLASHDTDGSLKSGVIEETALSSAVQAKLNAGNSSITSDDITDATTTGRSVLIAADAESARTAIGAGTSNLVIGTTSTTAKAGNYSPTKTDVGLGNVDNTSDDDKPVSAAVQTELDGKANITHTHTISQVTNLQTSLDGKAALSHTHGVNDVTGLQSALDSKAQTAHTHTISDTTGLQDALDEKADSESVGAKVLLIDDAAALPAGTPAGVVVIVKS